MRYTQPTIVGTHVATAAIQSDKTSINLEANLFVPSPGPAYQAEE